MSMYGCVLWDLQSKSVNMFHTAWRKCIRRLYGLPSRTHNDLLPTICQDIPVEGQIHVRFLKFIHDSLLKEIGTINAISAWKVSFSTLYNVVEYAPSCKVHKNVLS